MRINYIQGDMKTNKDYIGKEFAHSRLKKVLVTSAIEGTRVFVDVQCIDKGAGWNETKKRYTGHKNTAGWMRGENREFGTSHRVNINELATIDNLE